MLSAWHHKKYTKIMGFSRKKNVPPVENTNFFLKLTLWISGQFYDDPTTLEYFHFLH